MNLDLNQLVKWRREFHRFPEIGWSEFWTTSRIADYLEGLGCFEIFLGKQIINPDFVRGRKKALVDKGLANAKAYGANEKWLEKMEGYTGCVALFDSGKPGKTIALRFDIDCVNVTENSFIRAYYQIKKVLPQLTMVLCMLVDMIHILQ